MSDWENITNISENANPNEDDERFFKTRMIIPTETQSPCSELETHPLLDSHLSKRPNILLLSIAVTTSLLLFKKIRQ